VSAGHTEPLHPKRQDPLTPLERDLWRLGMVAQETQILTRGLEHYRNTATPLNGDLLFSVTNQALITIVKFLEVWHATKQHAKSDSRVSRRRRALQPIIDRIEVWKGLRLFRNSTLAHPYLTRDGKLIEPNMIIRHHGVPFNNAEILLLLKLINFAVLGFISGFEDEFLAIWPVVDGDLVDRDLKVVDPAPGIHHESEIDPELRKVLAVAGASLKAQGLTISAWLSSDFQSRLNPHWKPDAV